MTGKELLLVLAGTAVAAGGAGVAAAVVANGGPADGADRDALILERLDELGRTLDSTETALERNREAVDELGDRISAVELRTVGRPGRVDRHAAPKVVAPETAVTEEGGFRFSTDGGPHQIELGDGSIGTLIEGAAIEGLDQVVKGLEQQVTELTGSITGPDGQPIALGEAFKGLAESMQLRRLPEAERWEKAREELGLSQNQIDEIQAATAARDEAMDGALTVERSETGEGAQITVKNLDPMKAKSAQEEYRRRVDNTLNDEQRKGWQEKGYDRAFGKNSMGGSGAVITLSATHTLGGAGDDSE